MSFTAGPRDTDALGKDFDAMGRISAGHLLALGAGEDAHYMLCGPARFVADLHAGLVSGGVPPGQIHVETFGPAKTPQGALELRQGPGFGYGRRVPDPRGSQQSVRALHRN